MSTKLCIDLFKILKSGVLLLTDRVIDWIDRLILLYQWTHNMSYTIPHLDSRLRGNLGGLMVDVLSPSSNPHTRVMESIVVPRSQCGF